MSNVNRWLLVLCILYTYYSECLLKMFRTKNGILVVWKHWSQKIWHWHQWQCWPMSVSRLAAQSLQYTLNGLLLEILSCVKSGINDIGFCCSLWLLKFLLLPVLKFRWLKIKVCKYDMTMCYCVTHVNRHLSETQ